MDKIAKEKKQIKVNWKNVCLGYKLAYGFFWYCVIVGLIDCFAKLGLAISTGYLNPEWWKVVIMLLIGLYGAKKLKESLIKKQTQSIEKH